MIVLDASAVVELLLRSAAGRYVAERLSDPDDVVHAPHLLFAEVAQVLRRQTQAGIITPERGRRAVSHLCDLGAVRHGHESILPRAWELRDNLTVYDALYVALAEALDAPLLTFDAKLANAPGHQARTELLD